MSDGLLGSKVSTSADRTFVFAYGAFAGEGAGATCFLDIQGREGAEHHLYLRSSGRIP